MTKLNKQITILAFALFSIALSSCQKEKITKADKASINTTEAKKIANELISMVWASGSSNLSFKNGSFECVTMTVDETASPKTTTFNYGSGCEDENGIVRKGSIVLSYDNDDIQVPGTVITYNFDEFYINNDQVKGTMTLENTGINSNGFPELRYVVDVTDISPVNGDTQFDSEQFFEWLEGGDTYMYDDDVFSIKGYFGFYASSGAQSLVTINSPLTKNNLPGCERFFTSGVTLTQTTNESDRVLDYGNGECDNIATLTVDGNTTTIILE